MDWRISCAKACISAAIPDQRRAEIPGDQAWPHDVIEMSFKPEARRVAEEHSGI